MNMCASAALLHHPLFTHHSCPERALGTETPETEGSLQSTQSSYADGFQQVPCMLRKLLQAACILDGNAVLLVSHRTSREGRTSVSSSLTQHIAVQVLVRVITVKSIARSVLRARRKVGIYPPTWRTLSGLKCGRS